MKRTVKVDQRGNLQIKTIIDEDTHVTTSEVRLVDNYGNIILSGRGTARWNPIDYYDPEIGEGIALGRALAKYGKKLAVFWQKQSGSLGEHRAAQRRANEIQEMGEVYYWLGHRKAQPKKEKAVFPNTPHDYHGEWCMPCPIVEKAQAKAPSLMEQIAKADGPWLDEMAKTADTVDTLDTVIEQNRAKLEIPKEGK